MDNEKIIVIAHGFVKPNYRNEFIQLLEEVRESDEAEPGTIVQTFQFERDNSNVLWTYIVYANAEARAIHHQRLQENKNIVPKLLEAYATWPYNITCTPLCAKGVDLT